MSAPEALVVALVEAGWHVVGGRDGEYSRLQLVGGGQPRSRLMVPLDRSAPEFEEMWGAVIRHLEQVSSDGRAARRALVRFSATEVSR